MEFISVFLDTIIALTAIISIAYSIAYSRKTMKEVIDQKELQYRPLIRQIFLAKNSENLQELLRIQNIGSGHALNVKLWWKIQDFGGTFKENAIVQDKINFGIIGKDEIRQLRVFENKRMFQSIDEYCRFQTDKIYQLAYLISYEDIFDNSYIYLAYYKIHDGKIEEIKSFPISRKASEAEINVYGLNKLEH